MTDDLPAAAGDVSKAYPKVWAAYAELGRALGESGPLDAKTRRIVKLALSIGGGLEGAVHSHARRALSEGLSAEELKHAALLAVTTLGFPRAAAAFTSIADITEKP